MKKFNFTVKSNIRNYNVIFDTFENSIEINEGDYIIIDSNVDMKIEWDNTIKINPLETTKDYFLIFEIINQIIESGFKKNNRIIAIGGGIIQDIVGFISSILYRGIEWTFYPTTLTSQGDSCIGSKTSINMGCYKNVLGNFYPPSLVVIDNNFLTNLSDSQIISGMGEIMHYFLIDGRLSFEYIKRNYNNYENIEETIYKSLLIKKRMVEVDEFDQEERKILSYGHTFGHAIESISNYEIPHGIAVAYGMSISNYVSYMMGYLKYDDYIEMEELLMKIYSYKDLPEFDTYEYIESLKKDKKSTKDTLNVILVKEVGEMFLDEILVDDVYKFIDFKLKELMKK